jgi:sugar lactone lactonase YvrE
MTPSGALDIGDLGQPSNPGGDPLEATLNGMRRAAFDPDGNLFFADSGNNRVRRIDRLSGVVTTVVGSGERTLSNASNLGDDVRAGLATLFSPIGLAFDREGNLLIGDTGNHRIRIVKP